MADVKKSTKAMRSGMRELEIRTRRMVDDSMAGAYHSVFKGRGMDFDEVREYSPGDEVRIIDWTLRRAPDVRSSRSSRRSASSPYFWWLTSVLQEISAPARWPSAIWPRKWPACWLSPPFETAIKLV